MNKLKTLSDSELWEKTKQASAAEKSATLVLLEYLEEVDRRKLYAKRGFSTLWKMVVEELKYL